MATRVKPAAAPAAAPAEKPKPKTLHLKTRKVVAGGKEARRAWNSAAFWDATTQAKAEEWRHWFEPLKADNRVAYRPGAWDFAKLPSRVGDKLVPYRFTKED